MTVTSFRACELVSRHLSSNSSLGGETREHSREWVARRHSTANQKLMRVKEKTLGSQMASSFLRPGPVPRRARAASLDQIDAQRRHFRALEHLNLDSRMERARKIHHD